MIIKRKFEINIEEEEYFLLKDYGFYFEKNIEDYLKDIATELKTCLEENKKTEK